MQKHMVGAITVANCTCTHGSVLWDMPTPRRQPGGGRTCQWGSDEPVHSIPSRQWTAGCHETVPSL